MTSLPIGPHRVEAMVKFCLETASRMLETNGAFSPWGAVIDSSGDRKLVVGENREKPATATEAYALLERSMAAQYFKGEIVAGVIVAEASVPPELKPTYPDAIRLVVESNTISRLVFLPFRRGAPPSPPPDEAQGATHPIEFGELIGVNVRRTIFVSR